MAYGATNLIYYEKKKKGVDLSKGGTLTSGGKNNGSALGYFGKSFVAGVGGVGEGIGDIVTAAGALLGGNVDYAKYVFKDNKVGDWHKSVTAEYNPGKVTGFVGDVFHGLGQSSVFLLNAIPGLGQLGTAAFFGGVIGSGISNAAEMTGDVGLKEVAYGTLTGATEGALEMVGGGMAKLGKTIGQGFVKNVTKSAVRKGLLRQVITDASSEFLEEFASEYTDTFWQKMTGVNPDAEYSFKNALYAGLVGFASGAVSAGSGTVVTFANNQARGKKIIESGNSQTLVNTATYVADKLAGSGVDFKNASDWVQMLRGQVNAYEKLSPEAKAGAKGQTILGEMQTALAFAEAQSAFAGVQEKIQTADEAKRAEMADYINEVVASDKRKKTYTAEDIAKNTDNVAWQLAIMDFASGLADIDGAIAQEEFVETNLAQQQGAARAEKAAEAVVNEEVTDEAVAGDVVNAPAGDAVNTAPSEQNGETVVKQSVSTWKKVQARLKENEARAKRMKDAAVVSGGAVNSAVGDTLTNTGVNTTANATVTSAEDASASPTVAQESGADATEANAGQEHTAQESNESGESEAEAKATAKKGSVEDLKAWLKETEFSVKELNEARRAVKGFDDLAFRDRLRIIRMMRSAEGVDNMTVRGVANLMLFTEGLDFRFDDAIGEDGLYIKSGDRAVVFINKGAEYKKGMRSAIAHELVHFLEGKKGYDTLAAYAWKKSTEEKRKEIRDDYVEFYNKNNEAYDESLLNSEIVASLVGELLFNERFLRRYAQRSESGFKRALGFLKDLGEYIKAKDKAAYGEVNRAIVLFENAMLSESREAKDGKRYAYAGKKAETADLMALANAEAMIAKGVDSETVRKETGWFKGYDGEWRFEIDDFDSSLIENPKLERHEDDGEVYFTGKLSDIFNHKELFKAYPELKDINIVIQKTDFGIEGIYQPNSNYITLSLQQFQRYTKEYYDFLNGGRKSEIEAIERSPEYQEYNKYYDDEVMDEMDPTEWLEAETKARNKFFSSEIGKRYYQLRWGKENYRGDKFEFGWSKEAKAVLLHELQHAIQKIEGFAAGTNTRDKSYDKNAGEIEARDVAKRADFSAEQRKNTRPDIDQEDVVFAERSDKSFSYIGDTKDDRRCYVSGFDSNLSMDEKIKLFKERIATIFNLGAVELKTDVKKITIKGDKFTAQKNIYGDLLNKKEEQTAKINSLYDLADILATSKYDPNSTEPETSYANPSVKPKNAAHKGVKYWYKFENRIVFDNVPYIVTFNIRDKGKEQYQYLIEFKEDKTPGLSNTAVKNLLRTDQASYNNSIPQKTDLSTGLEKKVVKRSISKKTQKSAEDPYFTIAEQRAEIRELKKDLREVSEQSNEQFVRANAALDEAQKAKKKAETYVNANQVTNQKLREVRATGRKLLAAEKEISKKYKTDAMTLAKLQALEAQDEAAKKYTKKEIAELEGRMEGYLTKSFADITNEKEAKVSKADKEQFAYDLYIALSMASTDTHMRESLDKISAKFAEKYLDDVYFKNDNGTRSYLKDMLDEQTYNAYVKHFARKLRKSFAEMGSATTYARVMAKYNALKEDYNKERGFRDEKIKEAKTFREFLYTARELRNEIATQKREGTQDEGLLTIEKELGRISDEKGRVSFKQTDKALGKFRDVLVTLSQEERSLTDIDHTADLISMLDEYADLRRGRANQPLSTREMSIAADVLQAARKILKEYNKVFVAGHWVDIDAAVGDAITDMDKFFGYEKEYKTKVGEILGKSMKAIKNAYFYQVLTPDTVIASLEGFKKNGLMSTLYNDVRVARQKANTMADRMKKVFTDFVDDKENAWTDDKGKNHSYRNKLNDKKINVNGNEISLGQAIYLLMLTKREQAHKGLQEGGFILYDKLNNVMKESGFKVLDIERARDMIANQLDKTDFEFLKMAEKFFNETSSQVKRAADMKIFGYTNVLDGYYVPIIRDRYSQLQGVTDARQGIKSIVTVYNKSFNQNTVENAKALEGKNVLDIIFDHADGLAEYSEMYLPLKAFDRVYNKRYINDKGQATSIRKTLLTEGWSDIEDYFNNLFQDIQGQSRGSHDIADQIVGGIRSGWVNSVLGLNVKVVFTQMTSIAAANQIIEMKYLAPAISKLVGDVSELGERADEYSNIIFDRTFDMGATKAMGNVDKISEFGKKSGFAIEWMDRRVCLVVFHAAELKVAETKGLAVGTQENAIEAAKIADEVLYKTQAMTAKSERSALQRSPNEVAKTLAMFTSDSVKNLSHFAGNVMKYFAHKQRADAGDATYAAELAKDAKDIGRSATTLVMIGVMLALISQLFKYIYAKEEDTPEEKVKDLAIDVVSSTFNILPIVSDIADKFVFGYDLSLNVFDIVNDTIEDTAAIFTTVGRSLGGEYVSSQEVGGKVVNLAKTLGTATGIPIAPVERTVSGVLRRLAPSTVYGYDAMLYSPSYTADLKAAVESGNENLAEHILKTLYKNEVTGVYTTEELEEVARLYQEGYTSVLPQRIGETVNDVKLTKAQRKQFNSIYSQASRKVDELIGSSEFSDLDDAQKAKAIKNLYGLYYSKAAAEVTGKEWTNAVAYSYLTDDYTSLFAAQAYKGGLSVQTNAGGEEVSVNEQFKAWAQNLGLSQDDLAVVTYANGVRNKAARAELLRVINSKGLSADVMQQIADRLGFAYSDGVVFEKTE